MVKTMGWFENQNADINIVIPAYAGIQVVRGLDSRVKPENDIVE